MTLTSAVPGLLEPGYAVPGEPFEAVVATGPGMLVVTGQPYWEWSTGPVGFGWGTGQPGVDWSSGPVTIG